MSVAFDIRDHAHIVNMRDGLLTIGESIRGVFREGVVQRGLHRLLVMCVAMLWGVGGYGMTRRPVLRDITVLSMAAVVLLVCTGVGLTSKSWSQSAPPVCVAVPILTTIPIWDDYCGENYSVGSDLYRFCRDGQGEAHTRTHTVIRVGGVTVACFLPPVQWDVSENGFCAGTLSGATWPADNTVEQRNCASGLTCESGQSCSPHDGNNCYRCLPDADGDGIDDDADTDDDNDGTPDSQDDFPKDATEDTDTDGDGTGDNADTDDDGDGVDDADDACPMSAGSGTDTDGDGCTDAEDGDDDGDGILDVEDVCPLDSDDTCGGVCAFNPGGTNKVGECGGVCDSGTCPASCAGGWESTGSFCLCPEHKSVNSAGECVCPEGSQEFGDSCQVPVECRSDQVRTESNTCACPLGQEEFDNGCAVPVSCRDDQERTTTNTCACPPGQAEHSAGLCSCGVDTPPPAPGMPKIDSLLTAAKHYFFGGGNATHLGVASQGDIMSSSGHQSAVRNLKGGTSLDWNTPWPNDPERVKDPWEDCFGYVGCYKANSQNLWVGMTEVHYITTCGDSQCCTTTFTGGVNDGFWDVYHIDFVNYVNYVMCVEVYSFECAYEYVPFTCTFDQSGPCGEFPFATPYAFIPFSWSIRYPDPRVKSSP